MRSKSAGPARRTGLATILVAGLLAAGLPARAEEPLHILAAGSLTDAMTALITASGLPAERVAPPVFGPSGVLRERIEAGAPADILASADMGQPRRLAALHGNAPVVMFTRNAMCALAPAALGVTPATLLDRMLDPAVRVATSTPGADPGGDYAWAVFARAEAIRPGARATLEAKALTLVGGPDSRPLVPGHGQVQGVFLAGRADIMLGYCSGSAGILRDVPGLASIPLPADLTVGPAYGLVVLTDSALADRLVVFVMSQQGQAILARHGFAPVALADAVALPAAATVPSPAATVPSPAATTPSAASAAASPVASFPAMAAIMVAAGSAPPVPVAAQEVAALPAMQVAVSFGTEHGPRQAVFEGPLLWTVLDHAHAIDPARPGEQVRQVVTVTGRDGYTADIALGELSPAFEGKQVILAERMDGKDLGPDHLRVIVPGEKRGGRSVHDVVRITVTPLPASR